MSCAAGCFRWDNIGPCFHFTCFALFIQTVARRIFCRSLTRCAMWQRHQWQLQSLHICAAASNIRICIHQNFVAQQQNKRHIVVVLVSVVVDYDWRPDLVTTSFAWSGKHWKNWFEFVCALLSRQLWFQAQNTQPNIVWMRCRRDGDYTLKQIVEKTGLQAINYRFAFVFFLLYYQFYVRFLFILVAIFAGISTPLTFYIRFDF